MAILRPPTAIHYGKYKEAIANGSGGTHGSVSFFGEGTISNTLPSITRAKSASRSLTLKASCCNRLSWSLHPFALTGFVRNSWQLD